MLRLDLAAKIHPPPLSPLPSIRPNTCCELVRVALGFWGEERGVWGVIPSLCEMGGFWAQASVCSLMDPPNCLFIMGRQTASAPPPPVNARSPGGCCLSAVSPAQLLTSLCLSQGKKKRRKLQEGNAGNFIYLIFLSFPLLDPRRQAPARHGGPRFRKGLSPASPLLSRIVH